MKTIERRIERLESSRKRSDALPFFVVVDDFTVRMCADVMTLEEYEAIHAPEYRRRVAEIEAQTGIRPIMGIDFRCYEGD